MNVFDTGLYKAVEKAGSVPKLADALGVSRQAVYDWLKRGWAPTARAIQIEALYGVDRGGLMDPHLQAVLTGTANETAKRGQVQYAPRASRKAEDSAADLV